MKKLRKIIILALSVIICLSFSACKKGGGTSGGNKPGSTTSEGDYIYTNDSKITIVYPEGNKLAEEFASELHTTMLSETYSMIYVVSDTYAEPSEHEIVIGHTNRVISSDAYNRMERIEFNSNEETRYLAYTNGKSIALLYDEDVFDINSAGITAFEKLVDGYIKNNTELTVKSGVMYSGITNPVEYQAKLDETEKAADWANLEKELEGKENAAEIVKALKDYYNLFSPRVLSWLADLYDVPTGGFYYSNSARNTVGFAPDIESTSQAFALLTYSGVLDAVGGTAGLPQSMKDNLGIWVKNLQDPNGYFYHPQWTKDYVDNLLSRRGRDLNQGLNLLKIAGYKPTYTVNGVEGDYTLIDGTKVDSSGKPVSPEQKLTSRLMDTKSPTAVSKVMPTANISASHLQSVSAFTNYLNGLDMETRAYYNANQLSAQSSQIKAADKELATASDPHPLIDVLEDWLYAKQNEETGTWGDVELGANEGNNAVLKLVALYNDLGIEFPRADKAVKNAINVIAEDCEGIEHVCDTYNTWFSICEIFENLEKFSDNGKQQISEIRAEIFDKAVAMIINTRKRHAEHIKDDGSFSYWKDEAAWESQGASVSVPHTNEGDVNATYICVNGTPGYVFRALGLTEIKPFKKADYCKFFSVVNNLGEIIKDPVPDPEPVDFESYEDGEAADDVNVTNNSAGTFTVITDPRNSEEKVYLIDSKSASVGDLLRINSFGSNTPSCLVFETDMMVEEGNSGNSSTVVAQIQLGNSYMLVLNVKDDKVFFTDSSSTTNNVALTQDLGIEKKTGEWFNLRVEYYTGTHDTVRIVIYIDGIIRAVSDNYYDGSGLKLIQTGTPASDYSSWSMICLSKASLRMMLDNVLVYKDTKQYVDKYHGNDLLVDADPPVGDEKIYDFEDGTLPEDFTVTSGGDNISVTDKMNVTSPAGSAFKFSIPENKRHPRANATYFEALADFSSADVGTKLELALADDDGNYIAKLRLTVVSEGTNKFVKLSEAPDYEESFFYTVSLPAESSFKLGFEYYSEKQALVILINDTPVDITYNLCPNAEDYTVNKLIVTKLSDTTANFALDNIKLEAMRLSYDTRVEPDFESVTNNFEGGIPLGTVTSGNVNVVNTDLGNRLLLGDINSSVILPFNNRGFTMKVTTAEFELNLWNKNGESVKVTILANNNAPILEYVFTVKDGSIVIYESTENGTALTDASVTAGNNTKFRIEYYREIGEAHIYADGDALLASTALYSEECGKLLPANLKIEYAGKNTPASDSFAASLDNIRFETEAKEYKKLAVQTLTMGTGVYYNTYKDYALNYENETSDELKDVNIFRPGTNMTWDALTKPGARSIDLIRLENGNSVLQVRLSTTPDPADSSAATPSIHYTLMREDASEIAYVFESDVRFSDVEYLKGGGMTDGLPVFGFIMSEKWVKNPTSSNDPEFLKDATYIKDVTFTPNNLSDTQTLSQVCMVVDENNDLVGYKLHGKDIKIDTWYNIRITFNKATHLYTVYLNGEKIYTTTYMSINSITGMRVALNRNPGDNMNVQLDNTYFGTYHVDSAPTDGKNDGTLNGSEGVDGGGWS